MARRAIGGSEGGGGAWGDGRRGARGHRGGGGGGGGGVAAHLGGADEVTGQVADQRQRPDKVA